VIFAAGDEHERPRVQLDTLAIDDCVARAGDDEEPLVGSSVMVVRPALGLAGSERHLRGL
jgi:hypothetical protein